MIHLIITVNLGKRAILLYFKNFEYKMNEKGNESEDVILWV